MNSMAFRVAKENRENSVLNKAIVDLRQCPIVHVTQISILNHYVLFPFC